MWNAYIYLLWIKFKYILQQSKLSLKLINQDKWAQIRTKPILQYVLPSPKPSNTRLNITCVSSFTRSWKIDLLVSFLEMAIGVLDITGFLCDCWRAKKISRDQLIWWVLARTGQSGCWLDVIAFADINGAHVFLLLRGGGGGSWQHLIFLCSAPSYWNLFKGSVFCSKPPSHPFS